jgi:hypothetical protein
MTKNERALLLTVAKMLLSSPGWMKFEKAVVLRDRINAVVEEGNTKKENNDKR